MKDIKAGKEILTIFIVLTAIAVISGLLLGIMHKVTAVDEAQALKDRIGGIYASPIERTLDVSSYADLKDTEILSAFVAEDGAYIIQSKSMKAYSGSGLVLIVIIENGKVKAINSEGNSETPGLGSKALTDSYLNNFIGKSYAFFADDDSVGQSGGAAQPTLQWGFQKNTDAYSGATPQAGGIEAISGATKSSTGVRYAVKAALAFYESREGGNA